MYGRQSDNGNWDHMLDGTMDSIMQMQEPTEVLTKTENQLRTSSTMAGDEWLKAERDQINWLVTSMMTALDEMEWDRRKCRSSLDHYSDQIELLKSRTALWMSQLDLLQQAISHDPDMVTMGRSNDEGDQHVTNKFEYDSSNAARPEKRGDVDRDGGSLLLASFQGPDDCEILSRIDLLKKNAVLVVSSGNQQEAFLRSQIVSQPLNALAVPREGGGTMIENRAKLPPARQVKLPELLEATSPLETHEQG